MAFLIASETEEMRKKTHEQNNVTTSQRNHRIENTWCGWGSWSTRCARHIEGILLESDHLQWCWMFTLYESCVTVSDLLWSICFTGRLASILGHFGGVTIRGSGRQRGCCCWCTRCWWSRRAFREICIVDSCIQFTGRQIIQRTTHAC